MKKVTIGIPTYNSSQYISQAIESVLAQDYPNLEIVISDDCSIDQTYEIIKKYRNYPQIKYFRNEKNLGRVANYRKLLFECASGEWYLNLDGDDYLTDSSYVTRAMELVDKHPDIALVFAKYRILDEVHGLSLEPKERAPLPSVNDGTRLFFLLAQDRELLSHATCLYNRGKALALDFYRKDIISSDFESLNRLLINTKVGYIGRVAAVWRWHATNEFRSSDVRKQLANAEWVESAYAYARSWGVCRNDMDRWRRMSLIAHYSLLLATTAYARKGFLDVILHVRRTLGVEFIVSLLFHGKLVIALLFSLNKRLFTCAARVQQGRLYHIVPIRTK